jgi:DNA processing protein
MDRAHDLAQDLAVAGVHVVSGGALGIDGAAHRGCLVGGGTTTVVLGTGADVFYPARHAALFEEVLAKGGAIASLLPAGTRPRPGTFVQRNPLIAALADVTIVVEADVGSGSMSTARAALTQGRLVAAWPGSPGCDRLLAGGAAIVECSDDALAALAGRPRVCQPALDPDPNAARVRDAMRAGASDVDAIVRVTGLTVRDVLRALPQLESCPARMQ